MWTVTGAGGCGKTRMALAAAGARSRQLRGDGWRVCCRPRPAGPTAPGGGRVRLGAGFAGTGRTRRRGGRHRPPPRPGHADRGRQLRARAHGDRGAGPTVAGSGTWSQDSWRPAVQGLGVHGAAAGGYSPPVAERRRGTVLGSFRPRLRRNVHWTTASRRRSVASAGRSRASPARELAAARQASSVCRTSTSASTTCSAWAVARAAAALTDTGTMEAAIDWGYGLLDEGERPSCSGSRCLQAHGISRLPKHYGAAT